MNPSRYPGAMFVEESGTPGSPAIVLLHGAGQSGREWREEAVPAPHRALRPPRRMARARAAGGRSPLVS